MIFFLLYNEYSLARRWRRRKAWGPNARRRRREPPQRW